MSETSGHVVLLYTVHPGGEDGLRDAIRECTICTEEQSLDWMEQQERVDTPNQKRHDFWAIPLNLEHWELRLMD